MSEQGEILGENMPERTLIIDEVADPVASQAAIVQVQKERAEEEAAVLAACKRIRQAAIKGEEAFVEEVRHLLQEKAALPAGGYRLQLGVEGGNVGQVGYSWFVRLMYGGGDDAILKPTMCCAKQDAAFKDGIRMLRKIGWLSAVGEKGGGSGA